MTQHQSNGSFSIQQAMGLAPKQRSSDAKRIREARLQGDDMAFQGAFTNSGETFDEYVSFGPCVQDSILFFNFDIYKQRNSSKSILKG